MKISDQIDNLDLIEHCFLEGNNNIKCLRMIESYILEIKNNNISLSFKEQTTEDTKLFSTQEREDILKRLYTRFTYIFSSIILQIKEESPEFNKIVAKLISLKFILSPIFDSSIFANTDFFISSLLKRNKKESSKCKLSKLNILKVSVLYCLSSKIPISEIFELIGEKDSELSVLGFSLLSEIFVGSNNACNNKDWLLRNLPNNVDKLNKLNQIGDELLPLSLSYMYSSYSEIKDRHKIKQSIHSFIRRCNLFPSLKSIDSKNKYSNKLKPSEPIYKKKILVLHEHFTSNHSIYRCFKSILEILKNNNIIIGICFSNSHIDEVSKKLFHKHITLHSEKFPDKISKLIELISKEKPDIVYYPSIGMSFFTILISSYRLAQRQVDTYGHPAPTLNKTTDLVIEHEGVDKTELDPFSKYYYLSRAQPQYLNKPEIIPKKEWNILSNRHQKSSNRVSIAIAGMPFKITNSFINILKSLSNRHKNKIQFIIIEAYGSSIINDQIKQQIQREIISPFVLIKKQPFANYLNLLSQCQMFISPYPFGGNSIFLDCIRSGLIGPCLSMSTFPQNIERHFYELIGIQNLVSYSVDEYIKMSSDLINFIIRPSIIPNIIPNNIISPREAVHILTKESDTYNKEIKKAFSTI